MATTNFDGKPDIFGGLTIYSVKQPKELLEIENFKAQLPRSLTEWKGSGVRGLWFHIDLSHSDWVPILAQNGFEFHHAQPDYLMMTK